MAYYNRGVAYRNLGDFRQAIRDYDRATELEPTFATAYSNRGVAYRTLGDLRQAIRDFDRAIELEPEEAVAYYNRGLIYGKLQDYCRQSGISTGLSNWTRGRRGPILTGALLTKS